MRQTTTISPEEARALETLLSGSQRIVVTAHQGPDGDAVGSISAVVQLMRRLGKEATGIVPNPFPDNLAWIPEAKSIVVFNQDRDRAMKLMREADLIFCLDYNEPSRLGDAMSAVMMQCPARLVMIDHHLDPDYFCDLTISRPELCSTCELLLCIMNTMGWATDMTPEEATALYTGIMTDTGAFAFASNRPEVFEGVAQLLRTGIDKDKIYRNVFFSCTEGRFLLMGYLLYVKMEVLRGQHAAIITMTTDEYRRFNVKNGDTEGFVNIPLQIEGVKLSIFLREDTEERGKIRVSTRSVDDFPCNRLAAEFFNGGGHKNAAGGTLTCTIEEATIVARQAIKKYQPLLSV